MIAKTNSKLCGIGFALTLLSGCGGGGGGTSAPPPPPNQPPVAVVKLTGEAVLGTKTQFDTAGTGDADGTIASSSWNYGDGSTGSANSHVYAKTGSFTVSYSVTDNAGASASGTLNVTVAKCSATGTAAAGRSPFQTLCMQTSAGEMVLEVYRTQAPVTVANFLRYVDDGFYAGSLFHRVEANFVIQAGGYTTGLVAKPATYAPIALESNNGLKNWQYTLAMARTNLPNTATSQFYINLLAQPALDYDPSITTPNGYAVFGQVISGTAVVDAIGAVATATTGGLQNVPVQDLVISSVVRMP